MRRCGEAELVSSQLQLLGCDVRPRSRFSAEEPPDVVVHISDFHAPNTGDWVTIRLAESNGTDATIAGHPYGIQCDVALCLPPVEPVRGCYAPPIRLSMAVSQASSKLLENRFGIR